MIAATCVQMLLHVRLSSVGMHGMSRALRGSGTRNGIHAAVRPAENYFDHAPHQSAVAGLESSSAVAAVLL